MTCFIFALLHVIIYSVEDHFRPKNLSIWQLQIIISDNFNILFKSNFRKATMIWESLNAEEREKYKKILGSQIDKENAEYKVRSSACSMFYHVSFVGAVPIRGNKRRYLRKPKATWSFLLRVRNTRRLLLTNACSWYSDLRRQRHLPKYSMGQFKNWHFK